MEDLITTALSMQMGGDSNIQGLLIIEQNGVYLPGSTTPRDYYKADADGVYKIEVNVPIPEYKTEALVVTAPKDETITYDAHAMDLNGYNPVTINPAQYSIKSLTVSANGTYIAADYGCDGFDPVNVNVKSIYEELWKIEHPDSPEPEDIVLPDGTIIEGIPAFPKPTSGVIPSEAAGNNPQSYVSPDGVLQVQILTETIGDNIYPYTIVTNNKTGEIVENHDASTVYKQSITNDWWIGNVEYSKDYGRLYVSVGSRWPWGAEGFFSLTHIIPYDGSNPKVYYMIPN